MDATAVASLLTRLGKYGIELDKHEAFDALQDYFTDRQCESDDEDEDDDDEMHWAQELVGKDDELLIAQPVSDVAQPLLTYHLAPFHRRQLSVNLHCHRPPSCLCLRLPLTICIRGRLPPYQH